METTTTFTTWTRIFPSHTFEDAYDVDPNNDLDLTDEAREELREKALAHLTDQADEILATYGATLLGNGDIIGPVSRAGDFAEALDEAYGGIREELSMIDFDEILAPHFN